MMKSDIEIAQACTMRPIREVAELAGVDEDYLEYYGKYKAKIDLKLLADREGRPDGKLVLVTAINPTPAGEGKTTTTVGLADGMRRLGKNTVVALREPSLGPVFGVKGGAAGGPALDAEYGAQRGLPQGHHGVLAQPAHPVGQTYGGGGLTLPGRGGIDGGDQHQLAVGPAFPVGQQLQVDLGLVLAVVLQIVLVHTCQLRHLTDGTHGTGLGDLNIRFHHPSLLHPSAFQRKCAGSAMLANRRSILLSWIFI